MIRRKDKIQTCDAILVEKMILRTHDDAQDIRSLMRMRRGVYHELDRTTAEGKAYRLVFMTKKGHKTYYVSSSTYQQIKLNALGRLMVSRDMYVSFDVIKIATEEDVKTLGW